MKYGSKEWRFLQALVRLNPGITVGEASRKLALLRSYMDSKKSL